MPESDSRQMLIMDAASGGAGGVVVGTVVPGSRAEQAGLRGVLVIPSRTSATTDDRAAVSMRRVALGDVIIGVDVGHGTVSVRSAEELAGSLSGIQVSSILHWQFNGETAVRHDASRS